MKVKLAVLFTKEVIEFISQKWLAT